MLEWPKAEREAGDTDQRELRELIALLVEIQVMRGANEVRRTNGESPAYTDEHFTGVSMRLENARPR